MAQCKKILSSGERCSNRAVPGTDYCDQHRGIISRQDSEKLKFSAPAPGKAEYEGKKSGKPTSFPQWTAFPSAANEAPEFPGLRTDGRNILVAPQGIIWFGGENLEDQTEPFFGRLVNFLACFSQEMLLPGYVTVWMMPQDTGAIVRLTPPHPENADLSQYYDTASAAARLSGGLLYIGQERAFIRYRDSGAPRGYDAKDVHLPSEDELYLIDLEGTHPIFQNLLTEEPLDTLLLRIVPLSVRNTNLPEKTFVLVVPPLYRMLSRYLRDHHLRYRVARFNNSKGRAFILFEITTRQDAPAGTPVPAFVLSYLDGLPCCSVFTEVGFDAGRQMLVEWGQRYPCRPCNILEAFPSNSLLLFTASLDFTNLHVSPIPVFFDGDELIAIHTPGPRRTEMTPLTNQENLPLEISLQFVPDPGPTPSTAALILDAEEIEWVRRLLYRLPGDAFGTYTLCLGQEHAVLLGEGIPVESLPFGLPMRCVQGTQLFIPLRSRLVPDLPWKLLVEVLELKDDAYTFFTPEFRLDLSREAFAPLSRALVVEPGRLRVDFNLRSMPDLPIPEWSPPSTPKQPDRQPVSLQTISEPEQGESPKATPTKEENPVRKEMLQDVESLLLERAEFYRQAGDYLSAALCFAMSGDTARAARCYQEAAYRIRAGEREGNVL